MKLTEQDLRDACSYIIEETCVSEYGKDYKEKGLKFKLGETKVTVRMIVDLFIEWLKIRHQQHTKNEKI